ncbi:MAG: SGNH/GDSL hydrolase family protein [Planctomycetia bacterium]|nr:SGNH/GDSL hydrolase family protein [Planctomycetia bacterium]
MSESTIKTGPDRSRLLIVVATAGLVVTLAEWGSSRLVTETPGDVTGQTHRPENVLILLKDPARLPPPKQERSVWILGNSHTYALPGTKQGDALRTDEAGILIDELAARVGRQFPDSRTNFYLLSYPNFLPFEILTRVGHLLQRGHRPTIVVLGLTWRNIARDSQLRHEIYAAYRDAEFDGAFEAMLGDAKIQADPDIVKEVRAQRMQVEHDEQIERLRSDSDRIDESLTTWIGSRLTLMGKSAELRAQIFRTLTDRVQRLWDDRESVKYSYDLVEHDYAFNVKCLRAVVRLLKEHGATVLCYYAPERSDLPPLMDPDRQNEFIAQFDGETDQLGITVLDARRVVPNEYWGWVGDSPDRSHFTEPGHQRLAQFLWDEALRRSTWKELAQP